MSHDLTQVGDSFVAKHHIFNPEKLIIELFVEGGNRGGLSIKIGCARTALKSISKAHIITAVKIWKPTHIFIMCWAYITNVNKIKPHRLEWCVSIGSDQLCGLKSQGWREVLGVADGGGRAQSVLVRRPGHTLPPFYASRLVGWPTYPLPL